jgi:hypothetical protein
MVFWMMMKDLAGAILAMAQPDIMVIIMNIIISTTSGITTTSTEPGAVNGGTGFELGPHQPTSLSY